VVGIKVNPVGRAPKPGESGRVAGAVGCISNREIVIACVERLKSVGVRPQDIIVFERYADEFENAGYLALMSERPMAGVRWMASSFRYTDTQLDLEGFDGGRDLCPPEVAPTSRATTRTSSRTWASPLRSTIPRTIADSARICR